MKITEPSPTSYMETHCLHAAHTQDLVRGLGNALKRYIVVTRLRRPLQANELFLLLFFWDAGPPLPEVHFV